MSTIKVPYRQIRALYDDETITVYQAYSAEIAIPAVKEQKLSASPAFKFTRMTWIKPSWCWMMCVRRTSGSLHPNGLSTRYRSGYSYKDPNQAHILAIKMRHSHFQHLLSCASLSSSRGGCTAIDKSKPVRVQWDPERSPSLEALSYRSIQIGISRELSERWVNDWIQSIEDVTDRARGLKEALQIVKVSLGSPGLDSEWEAELVERGLVPKETVYEVMEGIQVILGMVEEGKGGEGEGG